MMNHYIDTDNKIWGFDETQTALIPPNAVLIPSNYTMDQIPYITLANGQIVYNQNAHDTAIQQTQNFINAKNSAITKLTTLGFTQTEITALLGS